MLRTKHFKKGGIHPPENKHFTEQISISAGVIPKVARIPLLQHLGKPAKAVVKKGDKVEEGTLIGEADGAFSANIHSSIPGTVVGIEQDYDPAGRLVEMIIIEFEGAYKAQTREAADWTKLSNQEILDRINQNGIVGLGGATFPTHIKVNPPKDKTIKYFLINGAECEPFLTCDHRLMLESSATILTGAQIVSKLLGVEKVFVCIENNKKDAQRLMKEQCKDYKGFEVAPLRVKYPQGGEKQLINAVLKKEVPSGGLPMDVQAIVSNVATCHSIYEAVVYNKPLTERVITVTGKTVIQPGNYKIKIGTPIKDILEDCGLKEHPGKIITGGPMMGWAQIDPQVSVIKNTNGVLVLSKKEAKTFNNFDCIRCGRCIEACPAGLLPSTMSIMIHNNRIDRAKEIGLFDCIECGCCAYVCPSERHMVQYFRLGKYILKSNTKYADRAIPVLPLVK